MLRPQDLVPVQRVDAVVPGDALHLGLAEELERLAPFGMGNPEPTLLVPVARCSPTRAPMGEGRHVAFSLAAGGARSRCVSFGRGGSLPAAPGAPVDAAVRLEVNRYNGAVEPRLVLRHARPAAPGPIEIAGEPPFAAAVLAELERALRALAGRRRAARRRRPAGAARVVRDARASGIAGLLGDLVACGEPVLAVTRARRRAAPPRCATASAASRSRPGRRWRRIPPLAAPYAHVVAIDPPAHDHVRAAHARAARRRLDAPRPGAGPSSPSRAACTPGSSTCARRSPTLFRALRHGGPGRGAGARAPPARDRRPGAHRPRSPAACCASSPSSGSPSSTRAPLRVAIPAAPARTALERSAAFRAYRRRLRTACSTCGAAEPARRQSADRGPRG